MKSRPKTFTEIMRHALQAPLYEPSPRVKSLYHVPRGYRNMPETPRYIAHRYAIREGISSVQVMAKTITTNNALLRELTQRKKDDA